MDTDAGLLSAVRRAWEESFLQGETLLLVPPEEALAAPHVRIFADCDPKGPAAFLVCSKGEGFAAPNMAWTRPGLRRRGLASALMRRAGAAFNKEGVARWELSWRSPLKLCWAIPGAPGRHHNNAPGDDTEGPGYAFLRALGFRDMGREVAMHRELRDYALPLSVVERIRSLKQEGVAVGLYDPALCFDFARMCDRVGSEHWKNVLKQELASPRPRPVPCATVPGYMVAFAGPAEVEKDGRGFFAGVCTDPEYARRGIATCVFHLLLDTFRKNGGAYVNLFTGENNPARRIYENAGLTPVRVFARMEKS